AGYLDQAEQIYHKELTKTPDDWLLLRLIADFYCRSERFAQAEPHLLKLSASGVDVPWELQLWGRRQLAVGLAQRAGPGDFERALALLELNRTAKRWSVEDQRVHAFVLATRQARRVEAVGLIEENLHGQPMTPL